jgi:ABC-type multidrug transport system permease subunit
MNNFVITPMIFFCGSFFPIQNLPSGIKAIVSFLPLSLANHLLRTQGWGNDVIINAAVLLSTGMLLFWAGVWKLERYSE